MPDLDRWRSLTREGPPTGEVVAAPIVNITPSKSKKKSTKLPLTSSSPSGSKGPIKNDRHHLDKVLLDNLSVKQKHHISALVRKKDPASRLEEEYIRLMPKQQDDAAIKERLDQEDQVSKKQSLIHLLQDYDVVHAPSDQQPKPKDGDVQTNKTEEGSKRLATKKPTRSKLVSEALICSPSGQSQLLQELVDFLAGVCASLLYQMFIFDSSLCACRS